MTTVDRRVSPMKVSEFGVWLKKWRKARRYTQQELAAKAGCAYSLISMYERGARAEKSGDWMRPEPELVEKLSIALSRPVEEARALAGYNPSPVPVSLRDVDRLLTATPGSGVVINLTSGELENASPDSIEKLIDALREIVANKDK